MSPVGPYCQNHALNLELVSCPLHPNKPPSFECAIATTYYQAQRPRFEKSPWVATAELPMPPHELFATKGQKRIPASCPSSLSNPLLPEFSSLNGCHKIFSLILGTILDGQLSHKA
jgi:hypothetical protein